MVGTGKVGGEAVTALQRNGARSALAQDPSPDPTAGGRYIRGRCLLLARVARTEHVSSANGARRSLQYLYSVRSTYSRLVLLVLVYGEVLMRSPLRNNREAVGGGVSGRCGGALLISTNHA